MIAGVLAALLAVGPKPVTATLWIPARVAILPLPGSSLRLLARVRIVDEGRVLEGCPALVWEWGDGERSIQEPTCLSAQAAARAPEIIIESRTHPYYRSGTMQLRVRVFYRGKLQATAETTIEIR